MNYSGPPSDKFWERINKIKPRRLREAIYTAGCALQDHERRVLTMISDAERELERPHKK